MYNLLRRGTASIARAQKAGAVSCFLFFDQEGFSGHLRGLFHAHDLQQRGHDIAEAAAFFEDELPMGFSNYGMVG